MHQRHATVQRCKHYSGLGTSPKHFAHQGLEDHQHPWNLHTPNGHAHHWLNNQPQALHLWQTLPRAKQHKNRRSTASFTQSLTHHRFTPFWMNPQSCQERRQILKSPLRTHTHQQDWYPYQMMRISMNHRQRKSKHWQKPTQQLQKPQQSIQPQAEPQQTPRTMDDGPLPTLPLKRPLDTLALSLEENGTFSLASRFWNGAPPQHYGPPSRTFFKCYTTTKQRPQDIQGINKPAEESDTSVDSEDYSTSTSSKRQRPQHHAAGLTRQERKQLDREILWRHILTMLAAYIDKFLAAIEKEAGSWSEWQSVRPLSKEECHRVLQDKLLRKGSCAVAHATETKKVGQGEVKATLQHPAGQSRWSATR